ncbi:NAD-dependent malic enzyme [Acidaminococcus sp. NSJ-142]|jgi:malate dehydrogenase (oxaloacetate-decarboxylating)|nr:NAD-dependent malic enzyme [Acidaminococcus hominis]MCH4095540.1 NAD-dependent malic enzyme [Acidaminococcus provencensis]RHK01831.1 NAD-dependent malic enzyme [Acidaminococcus sp. AM05-11]
MTKSGFALLRDPFLNKGTAFSLEEREKAGISGLLPPVVETIDQQAARVYAYFSQKTNNLEKRNYLMEVFNTNRRLFFYAFTQHLEEWMPIVYDPVIAESIETYSEKYVTAQKAAFLSLEQPEAIEGILKRAADNRKIQLIVCTDAEAILGIGDWGINGVDISVGKLMVYNAAGINPEYVLPVVLDCGTDRESLLQDPLYLGARHKRVRGDAYLAFVDAFVAAVEKLFPGVYLHFEDFGREHAAKLLNRYRNSYPVFNDDCQGTGIITLSGLLGAMKITGEKLTDQRYMCFGAGTAGAGITAQICQEMVKEGLSEEEAKKHFYMVDKQGLLFDDMEDLTPEQRPFARKRDEFAGQDTSTLQGAVIAAKPTILVGTSTTPKTFTKEIVEAMLSWCDRPIIFPLSNPTQLAEASAQDLLAWSDGKALIGTGIPVEPITYKGISYHIGQANNALIYPGLGMGSIAAGASRVSEEMISAAAHALTQFVDAGQEGAAVLPPVAHLRTFTQAVAEAVADCAIKQGLASKGILDAKEAVAKILWTPEY